MVEIYAKQHKETSLNTISKIFKEPPIWHCVPPIKNNGLSSEKDTMTCTIWLRSKHKKNNFRSDPKTSKFVSATFVYHNKQYEHAPRRTCPTNAPLAGYTGLNAEGLHKSS